MTVPLANSVDRIRSIELAGGIIIYPKIVTAVLVGTTVTMAICQESAHRMRPTDSSRTPAKASKWQFFTMVLIEPLWKDHSHYG